MAGIPRARILVVALVALPVLTFAAASFYSRHMRSDEQQPPAVAEIRRGTLVRTVDTVGRLKPLTSVEVSSQISGLVTEVNVDFNTVVKKGQILARIDPSTFEQKLQQASADLAAAQAAHALNEINVRRLKNLMDEDLVTQQDYDQATALMQQSEANLLTRRAAVRNARVDLERCTITSPVDGIVIFRQVEVGKTVVSSFSAPTLFAIAKDMSRMQIVAPVNEVDVRSVVIGQGVSFTVDAIPQREFSGRVMQIRDPYTPSDRQPPSGNAGQQGVVTFDVAIEVDNTDLLLRSSLTANVSILLTKRENVLLVPNGALHFEVPAGHEKNPGTEPRSAAVYRLESDSGAAKSQAVQVRLGLSDGGMTEVLSGLVEGDRVVVGSPTA